MKMGKNTRKEVKNTMKLKKALTIVFDNQLLLIRDSLSNDLYEGLKKNVPVYLISLKVDCVEPFEEEPGLLTVFLDYVKGD